MEKDGALIVVSLSHPTNALVEMKMGSALKFTEANEIQPWKTHDPICMIEAGKVTAVNDVHPAKVLLLRVVMLEGRVMVANEEH